jgi:hypothetical protein
VILQIPSIGFPYDCFCEFLIQLQSLLLLLLPPFKFPVITSGREQVLRPLLQGADPSSLSMKSGSPFVPATTWQPMFV